MTSFRNEGRPSAEILAELESLHAGDFDWRAGRLPLYMFSATEEVQGLGKAAFNAFFSAFVRRDFGGSADASAGGGVRSWVPPTL